MKAYKYSLAISVLLVTLAGSMVGQQTTPSLAVVPKLVNFSGKTTDVKGNVVSGIMGITFSIYKDQYEGAPLWMETQNVTADAKGNYTVQLGATKSDGLPLELFSSGEARWLGVRVNGGEEQPRVLLLSVPYALKAADAQTLGGLPASAFVLAAAPNVASSPDAAISNAVSAAVTSATVSGTGTADYIPMWTNSTGGLGDSVLYQTGTGSTARIGIGTTKPGTTLDVNGTANVRGTLYLNNAGTATASKGYASRPQDFIASAYSSSASAAVPQTFQWQAEPMGNNTANPSATLNLLFGQSPSSPAETGFSIASNGHINFASGQTFPGTVKSVSLTAPASDFTVSGSPVTSSGTLGLSWTVAPTSANTADAIVKRDSTGSFQSGPIFVSVNTGVYPIAAYDISSGSKAIYAQSPNGLGVYGEGATGVYGLGSTGDGVDAFNLSGGYALYSYTSVHNAYSAYFDGPTGHCFVYGDGSFGCTGTKSAVVPVNGGSRQVALYAVEAPENWFEDFGSGQLSDGVAAIHLDPTFAQTVNTGMDYHVFLTPRGECEGLYVAETQAAGFTVRELHRGRSNVSFDYRIVARRKGYENVRLADLTKQFNRPKPRISPPLKTINPTSAGQIEKPYAASMP